MDNPSKISENSQNYGIFDKVALDIGNSILHDYFTAEKYISHSAEKGRILESIIKSYMKSYLPEKYGIGTGFIVSGKGKNYSTQQDIVIYDKINNTPLFTYDDTSIFPIEMVYATIEVKTSANMDAIQSTMKSNQYIRQMTPLNYIRQKEYKHKRMGYIFKTERIENNLPPRAYLICTRDNYSNSESLLNAIKQSSIRYPMSHMHGILCIKRDFLTYRVAFSKPENYQHIEGNCMANFLYNLRYCIMNKVIYEVDLQKYR